MRLKTRARLAMRTIYPQRDWAPIDVWDDERYEQVFRRLQASPEELAKQREAAKDAGDTLFSIIIPLFKTPDEYLVDAVESVLSQTYPHFELVLVNASPEDAGLRTRVDSYAEADCRVKVVKLDGNLGITENTNAGLDAATGDFVCFMDHDDWIEPDTLFEYAAAIRENPETDMLYCDEDVVEGYRGSWRHFHPMLKPDYSPELLMCKNYIVHMLAVRKSLVDEFPRPGKEHDGSQDYNLTLQAADQARHVAHVPKVLYHWRMSESSTATNASAKPYAVRSSAMSAARHLKRIGAPASIVGSGITHIHNVWFHPSGEAKVSVIMTQADGIADAPFAMAIEAFGQVNSYENSELIVVDSPERVESVTVSEKLDMALKWVPAPADSNMFERFNLGAAEATGDVLVFLDDRCAFVSPEPLEQLVGLLNVPGVVVAGPKVLYANNTIKHFGIGVSEAGIVPLYRGFKLDYYSYLCGLRSFQNTSAIGYQGMAMKKELFESLGGFGVSYTGELPSVAFCCQALGQGDRAVATCTVELFTTETPPRKLFGGEESKPDFPAGEISRLQSEEPRARIAKDPCRSPLFDQGSGYAVFDPALIRES